MVQRMLGAVAMNDGFNAALNLEGDGAAKARSGVGAHGIKSRVMDHLAVIGALKALL